MDLEKKTKAVLEREDEKGDKRKLEGSVALLFTILAISMSLFHLYTAGYMAFTAMVQRSIHLCFALTLIFLLYPASSRSPRRKVPLLDWALILFSVISCLYITFNWEALSEAVRIAEPLAVDIFLGIIATLLVLEATRRTAGMALPLVAVAAYAGAAIAGSDPMRTGYTAWRLGLAAFIVPFMFIYGPPLLLVGTFLEIFLAAITALTGVAFLAASIQGFILVPLKFPERAFLFAAALLLIKPGWMTDLAGIMVGIAIGVMHLTRYRKERAVVSNGEVAVPGGR